MLDLKTEYRVFMWDRIHKYINDYDLGMCEVQNFDIVGSKWFVMILQSQINKLDYRLIVDNIKKPIVIDIQCIYNPDKYHVFTIDVLDKLPNRLFRLLNNNGLFMTDNKKRRKNAYTTIYRLIYCISYNCKGITIHHKKDKDNNNICNLLRCSQHVNNLLEWLHNEGMDNVKTFIEGEFEKEIHTVKKKKQYVSDYDSVQFDIIKYRLEHKPKDVVSKFSKMVKTPQTIRNILNYYYYGKEFLEWLKNNCNSNSLLMNSYI